MSSFEGHDDLLNKVLFDNPDKGIQYRFTVSEFRGKYYIGVREWYLTFEGDYAATKNGFTIPYNLHTASRLYEGFHELLSEAEALQEVLDVDPD